jgi:hypothetical protein
MLPQSQQNNLLHLWFMIFLTVIAMQKLQMVRFAVLITQTELVTIQQVETAALV